MIFVFIIGFALGIASTYIAMKLKEKPARAPDPLPADPAAEARIMKGFGKGRGPIKRRPIATAMPESIVIAKTGGVYHRSGCYYLAAGEAADTNKTLSRCTTCFRSEGRRAPFTRVPRIMTSRMVLGCLAAVVSPQPQRR